MKILGIFRGFPGLGRVVGGVSLLEEMRDTYGHKIKLISYLQGNKYLESRGYSIDCEANPLDYCSIGLCQQIRWARIFIVQYVTLILMSY